MIQRCVSCNQEKKNYKADKAREQWLQSKYGLSTEAFAAMVDIQGGKCLICGADAVVVDHDHSTGKVRAILCSPCNTGLGSFRDNPEFLRRAAEYLENFVDSTRSGVST